MRDYPSIAIGIFEDQAHAENAIRELKEAGFTDDQLGMVVRDKEYAAADVEAAPGASGYAETGTHAEEGAATGAAAGAGIGALWALGIAAGVLPAIGPVIAGGILSSVLMSAVGGAAIAGIAGALIGLGIPETEARFYEEELRSGRTIVTVKARDRYDEARAILERNHGSDYARSASQGVSNTRDDDLETPTRVTRPR